MTRSVIVLALAGLASCTSPPPPVLPGDGALPVPAGFRQADTAEPAPLPLDWWAQFDDPDLTRLIETALRENARLDAADASVEAAEALLQRTALGRSLSTATSASAEVGRTPGDGQDTDLRTDGALRASWEADLFGRVRSLIDSAEFDLQAARETRRDLAVVIASETALAYTALRGAQARLDVARQNADAQTQSLELLQTLQENGRATRLDVERARTQFRQTLATIPTLESDATAALNRLAALTGRSASDPGPFLLSLREMPADVPMLSGALVTGTPEDLLRRRPDIRRAEADLASRLALGQAARADLFPTITLDARLVASARELEDLTRSTSLGFGIGPALTWAGPDLRAVRATIALNDAQAREALATYEQTLLDALSEVETALSDYRRELQRQAELEQAVSAARESLTLANLRYTEGLDDFLDVLDAQRTLLSVEDQLAVSRLQSARLAVLSYRSLGGMWDTGTLTAFRATSGDASDD